VKDISALATYPQYQRPGVGQALLRWGIAIGEELELPTYTECSAPGLELYKSMGFERLTHVALVHTAENIMKAQYSEFSLVVKMPSSSGSLSLDQL
jgi:N-acetylglutamate synthase-like GNAT family acetyltransferase